MRVNEKDERLGRREKGLGMREGSATLLGTT